MTPDGLSNRPCPSLNNAVRVAESHVWEIVVVSATAKIFKFFTEFGSAIEVEALEWRVFWTDMSNVFSKRANVI